ncbi:ATPase [Candidatus Woesearchaeota archaeon CG_4_10_14_0_2_um_filter_33_10]|nr:MAG: ATPase [Candidatus Woesearchaeota archaeon CG1_02_33_12]PIN78833.1 MAG: ATPase [Candidatus Woesearchaeota archaeon CG10_big_fil_rev_8_21_14_0_10_33_12]PIU72067.1 MAG: ATPase [Candidatus Woesearchaeota archaeon CG06_land_8_20_14_3_00_33_13]PIZ52005.1 MAG: ATPase [Candidatus Woesearchaeota archaeon CG_4_10_14_0_2_um_filter_33_10]
MDEKKFAEKIINNQKLIDKIKKEISNVVVGQEKVINGFLRALLSDGHVLVEGVPGLAKTLIVRTLSSVMGCDFSRIQFTPDLLPTDIIGITAYEREKGFYVLKGPIFSNFILADEINRAPPKVQSALLECMQEKQVTIGKETFNMPPPFFVLATQNPLEQIGVYPLPEAQIDRFLFKINISYPNIKEEQIILNNNITIKKFDDFNLKSMVSPEKILELQADVKKIYLDKKIEKYIIQIVDATRNPDKYKIKLGHYIEWGASPRASIGLFIASKAEALMQGKTFVTPQYVKEVAYDVLRHRISLNYEAQSENIKIEDVISEILARVPVP